MSTIPRKCVYKYTHWSYLDQFCISISYKLRQINENSCRVNNEILCNARYKNVCVCVAWNKNDACNREDSSSFIDRARWSVVELLGTRYRLVAVRVHTSARGCSSTCCREYWRISVCMREPNCRNLPISTFYIYNFYILIC